MGDALVAGLERVLDRRVARIVGGFDVRAVFDQQIDHVLVAHERVVHQGRLAIVAHDPGVDIHSRVYQELSDRDRRRYE